MAAYKCKKLLRKILTVT